MKSNRILAVNILCITLASGCAAGLDEGEGDAESVAAATEGLTTPGEPGGYGEICECADRYEYRSRNVEGGIAIENPDHDGDGQIADDADSTNDVLVGTSCSGAINNTTGATLATSVAVSQGVTVSNGITVTNHSSWTFTGSGGVKFWLGPAEIQLGGSGSHTWGQGESRTVQQLLSNTQTVTHQVSVPPNTCVRYCANNYRRTDNYKLSVSRLVTVVFERRTVTECRVGVIHMCNGPFYGPWEETGRREYAFGLGEISVDISYDHSVLTADPC